MGKTFADMDVIEAKRMLNQCGPAAMYDYMEGFGDKYAALANGVARGGSLSGNAALRHMRAVAEKNGKILSDQDIDKIRSDMAYAYLNVRTDKHRDGDHTQLTAEEAQTFHRDVFARNSLPAKAWTLEVPFAIWGEQESEARWKDILDAAASHEGEMGVALGVFRDMGTINYHLSQIVPYSSSLRALYPEKIKKDFENLQDTTEWLGTNMSFENFKEILFGPEQPESTPEALECVIDPPVIESETLTPALTPVVFREPTDSIESVRDATSPAPFPLIGEPLKKNSAYANRYAANTAPANTINRLLVAHTPLKDALWAVSLTGREALSSLYHFTVRFKSNSPDLDCQAMIGQLCALELETDQNGKRWLSGQMVDFAATGQEGRHWVYEATWSQESSATP